MNYMISRDGQEFGPYTLSDLQRYLASGEVLANDMARSEGMTEFLPVSQIVGTIPVPATMPAISLAPAVEYPDPPNLHWGLVLLFEVVTLGMFSAAWGLVLAFWLRKVAPGSRSIYYYAVYAASLVGIFLTSMIQTASHTPDSGLLLLLRIVSVIFSLVARFSMRDGLEDHYNNVEPMGLSLSGIMTFFFATIYFQYHLNDIVRRKRQDQAYLASA
jgi:hypothetical protein